MDTQSEHIETVIIGGGQAGLSVGYHLQKRQRSFVILDDHERVGDNWRRHWDSMRLFSPARADKLPGMAFPASTWHYPSKDEMADYLEEYAAAFGLPLRSGVRVESLSRDEDGFVVATNAGVIHADNVVVATGTFGRSPRVPDFATDLDPDILQMHSSEYLRPGQLQDGAALVVGASHSGADIAYEIGSTHDTVLSGHVAGEMPFRIESRPAHVILPLMLFVARHLLTIKTPIGRKMRPEVRMHGGPLLRVKKADLARVGVEWTPSRTAGVTGGQPVLDDGRILDVTNVIWCTGFRQDFGWIKFPVLGEDGWPDEKRGVVTSEPGLYFSGLAFQFGFTSMLVTGADNDAKFVAEHIATRSSQSAGRRGLSQLRRAS